MNFENKKVLVVGAHPDDAEIFCGGTMFLLRQAGYELHLATMALGDCGSTEFSPQETRRIRRKEAEAACEFLGATYHYVGFNDLAIFNDDVSNRRTAALLRDVNPLVVITHPPQDYMLDHETTSVLVRTACFSAPAPNYDTASFTPVVRSSEIPFLYYFQPLGERDIFGQRITAHFYVDTGKTVEARLQMLAFHESQRNWLRAQHGLDDYMIMARQMSRDAGEKASRASGRTIAYAEGFRQHLGLPYPQENFLTQILQDAVVRETGR